MSWEYLPGTDRDRGLHKGNDIWRTEVPGWRLQVMQSSMNPKMWKFRVEDTHSGVASNKHVERENNPRPTEMQEECIAFLKAVLQQRIVNAEAVIRSLDSL